MGCGSKCSCKSSLTRLFFLQFPFSFSKRNETGVLLFNSKLKGHSSLIESFFHFDSPQKILHFCLKFSLVSSHPFVTFNFRMGKVSCFELVKRQRLILHPSLIRLPLFQTVMIPHPPPQCLLTPKIRRPLLPSRANSKTQRNPVTLLDLDTIYNFVVTFFPNPSKFQISRIGGKLSKMIKVKNKINWRLEFFWVWK